jgi:CarD family transcriptional regulator
MSSKVVQKVREKEFSVGDTVVYPSHGVGRITGEEIQEIAGHQLKLYVISFDKDKMILRVPKNRAEKSGLRQLSTTDEFKKAITTLKGKAKVARGMWSKRAQEYEAKINSGNVVAISEVLRDLHRNVDDPNRSYSERMIYESALERFTHEYAAAESIGLELAAQKVSELLENAKALSSRAEAA